jgi:hypothetical protein
MTVQTDIADFESASAHAALGSAYGFSWPAGFEIGLETREPPPNDVVGDRVCKRLEGL